MIYELDSGLKVVKRPLVGKDFFDYLKIEDLAAQVQWLAVNYFAIAPDKPGQAETRLTIEQYMDLPIGDGVKLNAIANESFTSFANFKPDSLPPNLELPISHKPLAKRELLVSDYLQYLQATAKGAAVGLSWLICNSFSIDGAVLSRALIEDLDFDDTMALCGLAQGLFMKYQGERQT